MRLLTIPSKDRTAINDQGNHAGFAYLLRSVLRFSRLADQGMTQG
jgi:hypothetical protein